MTRERSPPAARPVYPADNILACIHVLSNRISRAFLADIRVKHGLGLAEWRVILTLAHRADATGMDITTFWGLEKMAVNRAVARLVRRGAVRRMADGGDRRRQPLRLTPAGRRLYRTVEPDATARYRAILAPLGMGERRRLLAALRTLIARADAFG